MKEILKEIKELQTCNLDNNLVVLKSVHLKTDQMDYISNFIKQRFKNKNISFLMLGLDDLFALFSMENGKLLSKANFDKEELIKDFEKIIKHLKTT